MIKKQLLPPMKCWKCNYPTDVYTPYESGKLWYQIWVCDMCKHPTDKELIEKLWLAGDELISKYDSLLDSLQKALKEAEL